MNILMNKAFILLLILPGLACAQGNGSSQVVEKTVISYNDTMRLNFLHDASIYTEGWDTLNQTKFWREVINLSSDTCIINVASCRQPLDKVCRGEWMQLTEDEKKIHQGQSELCQRTGFKLYLVCHIGKRRVL